MKHMAFIAVCAGLLLILAANSALLINFQYGLEPCFPYWEGCYSVSRGIRSGPGLVLFKLAALPSAGFMIAYWILARCWTHESIDAGRRPDWVAVLGIAGAVFFVVYALSLGSEGDLYRWMRRYGVVFYFAGTALAQLLLASIFHSAPDKEGHPMPLLRIYTGAVALMWGLGLGSAFKRKLVDDPALLDRVENALEWNFALALSLVFLVLAMMHSRTRGG
jgi:hypothetical protein